MLQKRGICLYARLPLIERTVFMPLFPFMEAEPGAQIVPPTFHKGSQVAGCRDGDTNPPPPQPRCLWHLSGQSLWSTEASRGCKRTKQTSGD